MTSGPPAGQAHDEAEAQCAVQRPAFGELAGEAAEDHVSEMLGQGHRSFSIAAALLDAVSKQQPGGPRLVAFFGVMYYSGLRPEEAVRLREDNVTLPPLVWDDDAQRWTEPYDDDDWGDCVIT